MSGRLQLVEDRVPLLGIGANAEELVGLYGGEVREASDRAMQFAIPLRRGVAIGGSVGCSMRWADEGDGEGRVEIEADDVEEAPKIQRVLLLSAGAAGSFLWILWPFFPHMGGPAWIGGVVAITSYMIALRKSPSGIAAEFLQRLAASQRSRAAEVLSEDTEEG